MPGKRRRSERQPTVNYLIWPFWCETKTAQRHKPQFELGLVSLLYGVKLPRGVLDNNMYFSH